MAPPRLSPDEAVAEIAKRATGERRVFIPGGCAEPIALRDAWLRNRESAANLLFCGLFLPGVNTFDYSSLHPDARLDLFLMTRELRDAFSASRAVLTPAHYSNAAKLIADRQISVAIVHASTPNAKRRASFGLAADISSSLVGRADYVLALVNKRMPFVEDGPTFSIGSADAVVEIDSPLATVGKRGANPKGSAAIAARVAEFVRDDDVVQIGIGRLPSVILGALARRQRLRIFSGMVSDGLLPLLDAGAILDAPAAITTGMAIGSEMLYARLAREWRLKMTPIAHTHAFSVLSRIEKFVSINACLEVDLFGQVNAEFAGAEQIACVGGMVDFIRGARAAPGGRAIVALHAQGKDGTSRIAPRLAQGAITVTRAEAPIVVTEHGAVDLDDLDMDARAQGLIAIAAPEHRAMLDEAWRQMRRAM